MATMIACAMIPADSGLATKMTIKIEDVRPDITIMADEDLIS